MYTAQALGSASEGTRTLVLICESVAGAVQLSGIEALHAANSVHAVPTNMMPAQNSPHMLQSKTFVNYMFMAPYGDSYLKRESTSAMSDTSD